MLRSLSLGNFKALRNTGEVRLAPISLLSGPNSSGKSSLIQALLLLKQTLESPSIDEPLILNGSWVALGEYDDIHSFTADEKAAVNIGVSFHSPSTRQLNLWRHELRPLSGPGFRVGRIYARRPYRRSRVPEEDGYELNLGLCLEKAGPGERSGGSREQILLRSAALNIKTDAALFPDFEFEAVRDAAFLTQVKSEYDVPDEALGESLYKVMRCEPRLVSGRTLVGCSLKSVLPYTAWIADPDTVLSEVLFAAQRYFADHPIGNLRPDSFVRARAVLRSAAEISLDSSGRASLRERLAAVLEGEPEIRDLVFRYLDSMDVGEWEERYANARAKPPLVPMPLSLYLQRREPQPFMLDIDEVIAEFADFFAASLFYLGPLREEPRTFYRRLGSSDPIYVGQRGENTAFVLKYYGSRAVRFVEPPQTDVDWDPRSAPVTTRGLESAVIRWLRYLHLASNIHVQDIGKIGLSIQASITGGKQFSDLTNVGVGVSQVLPLIVLGLAAPPGSTLMFEQPELHLHPFVQSRLADFFLSLVTAGKQVIAETHSEHLIHRLRLYVAKGSLDPSEDLAIYFFTTAESGDSVIKHIDVGRYGEIEEWPKGFFDETTHQLDAILEAAFDRAEREEK